MNLKIKIISWLLLLITVLITQFSSYEFFQLNQKSLAISQVLKASGSLSLPDTTAIKFRNSSLVCHENWLDFIQIVPNKKEPVFADTSELLACSSIHMRMLRKLYSEDLELATQAAQLYPDETAPLYWLIQATDPSISNESKPVIQKILSMTPNDGLAWRYLGIILIREGNIPAAIEAHINCCNNGDPGSNGCYNAGRLYEQIGDYENAIKYYSFSKNEGYRANADRLEELLAGSD